MIWHRNSPIGLPGAHRSPKLISTRVMALKFHVEYECNFHQIIETKKCRNMFVSNFIFCIFSPYFQSLVFSYRGSLVSRITARLKRLVVLTGLIYRRQHPPPVRPYFIHKSRKLTKRCCALTRCDNLRVEITIVAYNHDGNTYSWLQHIIPNPDQKQIVFRRGCWESVQSQNLFSPSSIYVYIYIYDLYCRG